MAFMTWLLVIGLVIMWRRISALRNDNIYIHESMLKLIEEIADLKARSISPVTSQQETDASVAREDAAPHAIPVSFPLPGDSSAKPPEPSTAPPLVAKPMPEILTGKGSAGETAPTPAEGPVSAPRPVPVLTDVVKPGAVPPERNIAAAASVRTPPPVPAKAVVSPPPAPRAQPVPLPPTFLDRAFAAAKDWLFGGNTVLRAGVLLLFIGLAFLLRYASERVTVPVEFRYIGVGAAALALLTLGWRLRLKNAVYGLTLQGAGIAVLYLTSFAAMRLHGLLPPLAAFGLLVAVTVAATVLAVLQDAIVLACAAALGGFATPILVSTGSGDHVALFSYFALLNTGILLIAWFKAWRVLNLIGFVGTFSIGFAWGIQHYDPSLFGSTEAFLVLFFFTYVCISLLFARRKLLEAGSAPEEDGRHAMLRWSAGRADYIDGTMLFGPPLIGFGLQCALVRDFYLGAAFSALGLGLFYLATAYCLRGRKRIGLLMEICLALGVIFATLATPLAFDAAGVVSAIWAVEGAGIYWLGLVQQRRLARFFSLALIAAAALAYLQGVETGGATLLAGSPIGAALLGGALLFCHHALRRTPRDVLTGLDRRSQPALAASGLAFLYLLAPLCFLRDDTVIAWGLAGVASMFAGACLGVRAFRICALGILALAALLFLGSVESGGDVSLLKGSVLAAAVLGISALSCYFILRRASEGSLADGHRICTLLGCAFLYLLAPLCFGYEYTVIAWALAGLATVLAGLRLESRAFLACAFGIQLLGGLLFLFRLEAGGTNILASGWVGLLCASLIGLMLIASVIVIQGDAMARRHPALAQRLGFFLLGGLLFINMAMLFVLDWRGIGIGWAVSGLLLLWLGLWQGQRIVLYFGAALEAVAGGSFLYAMTAQVVFPGSWAPVALAFAAVAGAWRMHHVAGRLAGGQGGGASVLDPGRIGALSKLLLIWGMAWWVWATVEQVLAFTAKLDGGGYFASLLRYGSAYVCLLVFSLSAALWVAVARRARWRALALFACGLPLVVALWLLVERGPGPLVLGAIVWAAFFIVHLLALRCLGDLLPAVLRSGAHIMGVWLFVGVAMLAAHNALAGEGVRLEGAWPWLGWALAPSLYLWFVSGERGRFWPVGAFAREYRFQAALPIMLAMLLWFWGANAFSSGDASPLPYLPLLNPLELGLLLVLLACWRWSRMHLLLRVGGRLEAIAGPVAVAGGVSMLAFITMAVCRAAHAWGGVAFQADAMMASMEVQAAWSLVWALLALALMIGGSRKGWRRVWMAGALLIAVVVAKLFFIELGKHGSLSRIISFIGVGVLLLIVGYFSPLPPKASAVEERTQ